MVGAGANRTNLSKPCQHSASSHPPHVISFSDKNLWRVCLNTSDSFHVHTPFARGQCTDFTMWPVCQGGEDVTALWRAKCFWSKALPHPHFWGRVLHSPTCWPLGWGWREMQSSPQELQWGQQGHHQESLSRLYTVHKLCHWFPIRVKRKHHSINHIGKKSCFRKKEEDYSYIKF